MPVTMKELGLDKLSVDERTLLGHELLRSVEAESTPGSRLTEEQKAELDRRIAEADADPDGGIPWVQVRDEALARLRRMRS
jgi:putative addiction module component (TIGR02574 family)